MILIIDFGSQYTQLIAKIIRKNNVFSKIIPYHKLEKYDIKDIKGVILSGSPHSVIKEKNFYPTVNLDIFKDLPILGICYGCQIIAKRYNEKIVSSDKREFGKHIIKTNNLLGLNNQKLEVWMSHNDTIVSEKNIDVLAKTENNVIAAFKIKYTNVYGLQFHPEVSHTQLGDVMIKNFIELCNISERYTIVSYKDTMIQSLKDKIKDDKVLMAVSGGVDSTVVAKLLNIAIKDNLICVFIDNGLLRKNEITEVTEFFQKININLNIIDAKDKFYTNLMNISNPETKRKIIGNTFIEVFEDFVNNNKKKIKWLGQGTIYPDVIESVPGFGLIKSHHNVGGLPENMNLKLIEPIRDLFKNEVRDLGKELNIPKEILNRHPFPGPGLAIRIIGSINSQNLELLREADHIFMTEIKKANLYDKIWQAGVVLLPIKSVGVMGDCRTYEQTVALRAVCSENGMTAEPYEFSINFLSEISTKIINNVKGINRVVYDISTKPPATIEWE